MRIICAHQFLAGAFRHKNNTMFSAYEAFFQGLEEAVFAFKIKRYFGNKDKIDVILCSAAPTAI